MNELLTILGTACLTYLITVAEPVQLLLRFIGITANSPKRIQSFLGRLTSCCLCSGFWIGLIATQSITEAAIISVLAEVISRQLKNIPLN